MALWTVSGATTIVDACLERVAWVQAPVLAPLISMSSAQRPPPGPAPAALLATLVAWRITR